mmetsp:Transcript_15271/g.50167  ORF Transcript_15271/g.50167 Transcript_15271/m.50167 type:complete len:331 (+) Transcript_15271:3-995(+)
MLHHPFTLRPKPATRSAVRAMSLIVDTDAGVDDLFALALLASHGADLQLVTTVHGMSASYKAPAAVRAVLARVTSGAQCSVVPGAPSWRPGGRSLLSESWGESVRTLWDESVPRVLGYDGTACEAGEAGSAEAAAEAMYRAAAAERGASTLLCLGPLTNVATAYELYPDLPELFARVISMGGALHADGNTRGNAELNYALDPAAADVVLRAHHRSGAAPFLMCDLGTANERAKDASLAVLGEGRGALGTAGEIMAGLAWADGAAACYDPIAAAKCVRESVWAAEPVTVAVDVGTGETTAVDAGDERGARVLVATEFQVGEYIDLIRRGMR